MLRAFHGCLGDFLHAEFPRLLLVEAASEGGLSLTTGAWREKPGSATLPFFGSQPCLLDDQVLMLWWCQPAALSVPVDHCCILADRGMKLLARAKGFCASRSHGHPPSVVFLVIRSVTRKHTFRCSRCSHLHAKKADNCQRLR